MIYYTNLGRITKGKLSMYDKENVFAKIVRGEIPCKKIYENEYAISFYDINPIFSTHVLVIPRGEYENILDFAKNASAAEQAGFWQCFTQTAEILKLAGDFNVLSNAGENAPFVRQSVMHFHLHLVAGGQTPELQKILGCLCK